MRYLLIWFGISLLGIAPTSAATLQPVLIPPDISELFEVGVFDGGNGYAREVSNVTQPQSFFDREQGNSGDSAQGLLLDNFTHVPEISASGIADSPGNSGENSVTIDSKLAYEIEVIGKPGIVPVNIRAEGSATATNINPQPSILSIQSVTGFSVSGNGVNLNDVATAQITQSNPRFSSENFNVNSTYDFTANVPYYVNVSVDLLDQSYAGDEGLVTGFVDPLFTIDPQFASAYSVDVSPGIGNSLSSVPLPAGLPMFGAALFGLCAIGYGFKRNFKAA